MTFPGPEADPPHPRPLGRIAAAAALLGLVVAGVYGRSRVFGLWADDFQWVDSPRHVGLLQPWNPAFGHFYRPLVTVDFAAAVRVCGWSASCFHDVNLVGHWMASLAVCGLVWTVAESFGAGLLAAVLFAAQPGPVEAVTWVSAISEVQSTLAVIVAVWLFRRADLRADRWSYAASIAACALGLLTHESAIVALPLLWLTRQLPAPTGVRRARLWPYAALSAIYLGLAAIANARNYVVTEGEYRLGAHVVTNLAGALVSLAVARRDLLSLVLAPAVLLWAAIAAPPRVRYFAQWTAIGLAPFCLFRFGLPSRYLYLAAVGFSGLAASLLWWLRTATRRSAIRRAAWWVLTLAVLARSAVFTTRNVRVSEGASRPFDAYAARVMTAAPTAPPGSQMLVPAPPPAISDALVTPLLRWTYRDPSLTVTLSR